MTDSLDPPASLIPVPGRRSRSRLNLLFIFSLLSQLCSPYKEGQPCQVESASVIFPSISANSPVNQNFPRERWLLSLSSLPVSKVSVPVLGFLLTCWWSVGFAEHAVLRVIGAPFPGDRQRFGTFQGLVLPVGMPWAFEPRDSASSVVTTHSPVRVSIRNAVTWGQWAININLECSKGNIVPAYKSWL